MNIMKKLLTLSLVLFLFGGMLLAQHQAPTMSFTKTTHNFGNIKQEDGYAKVKFEFTNTGGKPIVISNVRSSCGCTTPSWTREPIAPGTKGYVEAAYNPKNRPGHFSKTITVISNATNSPIVLTIKGNVSENQNSMLQKYPQKVGKLRIDNIYLNFGNMYNDETKTKTFGLYNPTSQDVNVIVENRFKPSYTDISVEPEVIKPKETAKITVTYNADQVNDWDYVRGFLYLTIDGKRESRRRLQVSAIIKERFTQEQMANPPIIEFEDRTFDFDTIKEGDVVTHVFKFKNTGKSDLIIRKTRASCGCTAVSLSNDPVPPNESGEIKVTFNSSHKRNRQVKTVTVITNSPKRRYNKIVLRISGYVIPK